MESIKIIKTIIKQSILNISSILQSILLKKIKENRNFESWAVELLKNKKRHEAVKRH